MGIAKLFWFDQLSNKAQERVIRDANNQNIFYPEAYKGMMFYEDGRRYSH